jgi:UDPglucose 6-dehydrogenase
MQKIGIVGQGFVGSAVYAGFRNYFNVETYDLNKKSTCDSLEQLVDKSQFIFICLPTPMEKDGKCHIGIVESVISDINTMSTKKILIVKSTIPPGTTEMWNKKYDNVDIVFNPEFLTEANALDDFKNQTRIVLGGSRKANARVKRLFAKAFPKVPVIHTSSTIAEMVKYVTNCFLATKVSFANEMYQICDYLDIDYDKVIEYAKHDDRLGYSHWNVPGPDGDFGYGGHCFPKDVKALINVAMELESNVTPTILNATNDKNNEVRNNRDWEQQKGRAVI